MKKILYKIPVLLLIVSLLACDVERLPETQISDASFWKSEADIKAAANYLYTFLPGFTEDEVWSDNAYGTQSDPISDGTRLAPATSADYTAPYQLIRAANNIIEKVPPAPVTDAIKNRYIGEARFYRAYGYIRLVQKYGNVPLILKTLQNDSPELNEPAKPRAEIMKQIYEDLDFAAANLPTPTVLGTAGYGRIANTTALSMKARIALFEGTRAKFHKDGDPTQHLTLAAAAAKAVIDSKQHDLFANYTALFQYAGEGRANRENILVKQYGTDPANLVLNHNFSTELYTGGVNPTKSLVDSYLMKDGLPITKSPLYKTPVTSVDVFTDRDERLTGTVFKQGEDYNTGAKFNTPLNYFKTGFGPKKYFNALDFTTRQALLDLTLLRYAEVLLTYAEAKYELDGTISDADLDLSINLLRKRAKVAVLTNAFVTANGLSMQEEIRRERRVELALENLRYWDLIRWKTAETELPKTVLGNFYFKTEFGVETPVVLDPQGYIIAQNASFRFFDPAKDYLWPFPVNEIGLNPALKQNPKW
ncbi:RagB/SusD family nutrient uptake outer membrane protein [Dyadobacter psychrotolerans]|uniref:RagB/SusD family nutrient uptake outer membrane protein n=1 Tax=Dyadobacter psychrotolerans TaxID=2541721 RepID=A0A4R5DUH1_9BACT|nr:RagB/SusD family nutrient uptake outer membrane protein [Dyadobacter psychrotolerans]TDE18186.1 RagB/SusD family nutrient uptake outer membrane protein [Dyadobacter psychrotolerans]